VPPSPKIKNELLQLGFDSLKDIPQDDRATLMFYLIQSIHPFLDGNGRTGRFLFQLITDSNIDNEEKICIMVNHDNIDDINERGKSRNSFYNFTKLNRELIYRSIEDMQELDEDFLSEIDIEDSNMQVRRIDINNIDKNSARDYFFQNAINEEDSNLYCIAILIKQRPQYNKFVESDNSKYIINVDLIANAISPDDRSLFLEIHDKYKKRVIHNLIGVFKEPNKYGIHDKDGQVITLRDFIIKKNTKYQKLD
jgi:Fic/DOC family